MKVYKMNSVLDFGKYKGKTIEQLLKEDKENYLWWMYNSGFKLNKDIINEIEIREFENEDLRKNFN